jgi:adenine-specific DNA-methyltransferase
MKLNPVKPRKALNKAWLKTKPNRNQIEFFKQNLLQLLGHINETESEEFHKNLVSHFLKNTYYHDRFFINTKEREDLAIYTGKNAGSPVGVIIEAKKPSNRAEMLSLGNINTMALHELILYYMRERISGNNLELKHLVATNIYEWFIFDAVDFEKWFAKNRSFVNKFTDFEEKRMSGTDTDFFYKKIAAPFVEKLEEDITFTHFDLREIEKPLRVQNTANDTKLIPFFKLFSPEHLLKLPFANDSNSLDRGFYNELLHIIGLEETKEGSKKVIGRKVEGKRNPGSLIENAITILNYEDCLSSVKRSDYGATKEDQLFNLALELSITWMNRILFLKLLEGQLVKYHRNDKSYRFLNTERIPDYDALNKLFFQVLAVRESERSEAVKQRFGNIPYLNSSLFEPNNLEHKTIRISNLENEFTLPVLPATVLTGRTGKKVKGEKNTLHYLFEFLDAYDFSSEGSEEIQEENKTLINASVLGLIFEKINGYKDGSFFTPGFITMYMARETVRRAVVEKFNSLNPNSEKRLNRDSTDSGITRIKEEKENKKYKSIDDVYNAIGTDFSKEKANEIINSLKVCDPAVGSGHFLVSVLNEIIALKSDLKILTDRNGRILRDYHVEVTNDELVVTDDEGLLFEYKPGSSESQRIQETLFHEKQTIIENCLFGVDINPNSVKICRLRLWIELLKNAYYKTTTPELVTPSHLLSKTSNSDQVNSSHQVTKKTLKTLPNIDINIKTGNSLISRYPLESDLKTALKNSRHGVDGYRLAVHTYRNAKSKEQKHEMLRLIETIKNDFETEIAANDKRRVRLNKQKGELFAHSNQQGLFELSATQKKAFNKKTEKLAADIKKLETELEEIANNKIYENAFEWRLEFPEVLNDDGDFTGFDIVIGNPPYIRQEEFSVLKPVIQNKYETFAGTADLYVYFIELGLTNLKPGGEFTFIVPNKWMRAGYGKHLRRFLKKLKINVILDFGDLPVFDEATTYPCILSVTKKQSADTLEATSIQTLEFPQGLEKYVVENKSVVLTTELQDNGWTLSDAKVQRLLAKLRKTGTPLGKYVNGKIFYGIKTGLNEAFVIDETTKNRLIAEDPASAEIIKPFLAGRDIKKYRQPKNDKYLILLKNGDTQQWFGKLNEREAWEKLENKYPAIANHLIQFEEKAKKRYDKGQYWWELRACDYYEEFEKPKVMLPDISTHCQALIDFDNNFYCVNTAYIIPNLGFSDLAILNSKLVHFFYSNLTQSIRGGYLRFIRQYLEQIPIVETKALDEKVTQILALKKENPVADTSSLESEIDQMVYELYGLTEEEVKVVEGV